MSNKQANLSSNTPLNNLADPISERLVLSAILEHGQVVYHDVAAVLKEHSFHSPENRFLYSILTDMIVNDNISKPTLAAICAKAQSLDSKTANRFQIGDYVLALGEDSIPPDNLKPFLNKVQRLGMARNLRECLYSGINSLNNVKGNESILNIIAQAEEPFSNFTVNLIQEDDVVCLSEHLLPYIEHLAANKPSAKGIPTGMPLYDHYIGGGLWGPGVHMFAARSKVGKSFLGLNIANHVTNNGIPILYLDTELTKNMTLERWAALTTKVPRNTIETGQFGENAILTDKIKAVAETIYGTKQPFDYFNISGKNHQEWISIMRRWVMKRVGFDDNGNIKPCLIILDYLKLMDLSSMGDVAEFQYLGQVMTDLHNFCVKYNLPILAFAQLNRDGITKEDQSIISGSDRIIWLCSSFTLLKNKTPEDYASDPPQNGNKKLVIIATRSGTGSSDGEYINLKCDLARSEIIEGNLNTANSRPTLGNNNAASRNAASQSNTRTSSDNNSDSTIWDDDGGKIDL